MRTRTTIVIFLAVSACGGGGGGVALPGPAPFTAIVQEHRNMETAAGTLPIVTTAVTPPASPATYDGFIVFDSAPGNAAGQVHYSRISITADFNTTSVSGTANDFWFFDETGGGPDGSQVTGSITVASNGVVFDDPGTGAAEDFPLTITGSLDLNGGPSQAVTGSSMVGTFAGDDGGSGATNVRYFAGDGDTTFDPGVKIPTRIIAETPTP